MTDPHKTLDIQIRSAALEFEQSIRKQVLDDMREWAQRKGDHDTFFAIDAYEKDRIDEPD